MTEKSVRQLFRDYANTVKEHGRAVDALRADLKELESVKTSRRPNAAKQVLTSAERLRSSVEALQEMLPQLIAHCEAEDHQAPSGIPYDTRLSTIGLAKRTYSALEKQGVLTLGDLVELDYSDLMRLKGFGRTALDDVESLLIRLDLRL